MALNVGINGFGRIGRIIFRTCFKNPYLKVSAINDPAVDIEYICYLIKFDSTHGKFKATVERSDTEITIDGHKISIFREKLPTDIPWHVADVQYVVEASGMFLSMEKASGHLVSESVKRVLVTAPSVDVPMVVLGVNDDIISAGHRVISCASSTLYCLAPIIKILDDNFGVSEGFITSIHAMTPSLKPLDGLCLKGKHWRDHRSIHQNIIPANTGACRALGKIIPQVKDKMTGLAFRVPIINVSVLDITIKLKTNTTINGIIKLVEDARKSNMQNIIKVSNEQAVSSDFIGETFSCILDSDSSLQLGSDFFKIICWYENEHSYACRVMDSIFFLERQYQLQWKSKTAYIRTTPKPSFVQQQACNFESQSNSKSLCSTSQDSGFKSPRRSPLIKKPMSPRKFGSRESPYTNKDSKKNNELFKIWNDVDFIVKTPMKQNRGSFFHTCVASTPQFSTTTYAKSHERLEKVKKDFSKMVNMTENLLKQSQHSKIEISEGATLVADDSNIQKKKNCDDKKYLEEKKIFREKDNIIAIQANGDSKKNNEKTSNIVSNKYDNKNTLTVHENYRKISYRSLNLENHSSRQSTRGNIIVSSTLINTEDVSNKKCLLDTRNKNTISSDKVITHPEKFKTEKTLDPNNSNIQVPKLEDTPEAQKENKNLANDKRGTLITNNGEAITDTENNKYLRKERHDRDQQSNSVSKQRILPPNAQVNGNNNDGFEEIDYNKRELIDNQDEEERKLQSRLEDVLKKLTMGSNVASETPSTCFSGINTISTVSNRNIKHKQDIYDKLDSVSATDSENSFHMKERKSQVINITDLTNSLEDLERLDKICRIIEISDELSDQLLSSLSTNDRKELRNKKWSFKDLCEKIKLDDFCNKMFSKNN